MTMEGVTKLHFRNCTSSATDLKTFLGGQIGIQTFTLSLYIENHRLTLTPDMFNAIGCGLAKFYISKWLDSLFVCPLAFKSLSQSTLTCCIVHVDKLLKFIQFSKSLQVLTLEQVCFTENGNETAQFSMAFPKLTTEGLTELHFRNCTSSAADLKTFLGGQTCIRTVTLSLDINSQRLTLTPDKFDAIGNGSSPFYLSKWLDCLLGTCPLVFGSILESTLTFCEVEVDYIESFLHISTSLQRLIIKELYFSMFTQRQTVGNMELYVHAVFLKLVKLHLKKVANVFYLLDVLNTPVLHDFVRSVCKFKITSIETLSLSLVIDDQHEVKLGLEILHATGSGLSIFSISRWLESLLIFVRPVFFKSLTSSIFTSCTIDVDEFLTFLQFSRSLELLTLEEISLRRNTDDTAQIMAPLKLTKLTIKGARNSNSTSYKPCTDIIHIFRRVNCQNLTHLKCWQCTVDIKAFLVLLRNPCMSSLTTLSLDRINLDGNIESTSTPVQFPMLDIIASRSLTRFSSYGCHLNAQFVTAVLSHQPVPIVEIVDCHFSESDWMRQVFDAGNDIVMSALHVHDRRKEVAERSRELSVGPGTSTFSNCTISANAFGLILLSLPSLTALSLQEVMLIGTLESSIVDRLKTTTLRNLVILEIIGHRNQDSPDYRTYTNSCSAIIRMFTRIPEFVQSCQIFKCWQCIVDVSSLHALLKLMPSLTTLSLDCTNLQGDLTSTVPIASRSLTRLSSYGCHLYAQFVLASLLHQPFPVVEIVDCHFPESDWMRVVFDAGNDIIMSALHVTCRLKAGAEDTGSSANVGGNQESLLGPAKTKSTADTGLVSNYRYDSAVYDDKYAVSKMHLVLAFCRENDDYSTEEIAVVTEDGELNTAWRQLTHFYVDNSDPRLSNYIAIQDLVRTQAISNDSRTKSTECQVVMKFVAMHENYLFVTTIYLGRFSGETADNKRVNHADYRPQSNPSVIPVFNGLIQRHKQQYAGQRASQSET